MSPLTHLVASWLVAVATTNNPRDRKLVTLAGVLPDADGLGVIADNVHSLPVAQEITISAITPKPSASGVLPDADGLGVIADIVISWATGKECTFHYYQQYHHILLHGWPGAVVTSLLLAGFARERGRVLALCLLTFHLHLLCDFVGSRGPEVGDRWPICYSEPIFRHPIWFWKYQWRLDGWQNQCLFLALFAASLWVAVKKGYSFAEMAGRRVDSAFVQILQKWHQGLFGRRR